LILCGTNALSAMLMRLLITFPITVARDITHDEMYKYVLIKELTTLDYFSQSVIDLVNILI